MKTVYQERNRENPPCREEIQMTSGIMYPLGVSEDNPFEEFRNLINMLGTKNEILYRECRFDQKKARHIRSMGSVLSAMTAMLNRLHKDSGSSRVADMITDAQGFTYQTVRLCDLDRICDK
jgi:hypothetical protein